MAGIVIVGAGQAGLTLAENLRLGGHEGPLTLIGEEPDPPYQRPPLSKKYLLGETSRERLYLKPLDSYGELGIDLRLGTRVAEVLPGEKAVRLGDGSMLGYDQLALATGSVPRRLPDSIGGMPAGSHVVRTLADIDALQPECQPGRRVLVIGGGYIGLEAAAVAATRGLSVMVVEASPRILLRVAAPQTAAFFRDLHGHHGVEIREGVGVARMLSDAQGHFVGAELADDNRIEADFCIVGVGIEPATDLAGRAGLALDNGIAVDALGQSSMPDIYAAGDCASFPYRGQRLRLESVPHAIDHAKAVAASMLGGTTPYRARPWFWSDQYDVKLQIAGLSQGHTDVVVRQEDKPSSLSVWYFGADRLLAVDAMNAPRSYMIAKRWIEAGQSPDARDIADPARPLKDLTVTSCVSSAAG